MIGSVNRLFKALVIAAASVFAFTNHANAQKPIIYPDGHFPPGNYYTAADLARFAGRRFTASPSPSYLIGTFQYLGVLQGKPTFAPVWKVSPFAFSPPSQLPFKTVLRIHFFDNAPRNLAVGKAIVPNPRTPLTLTSVQNKNGYLVVETEYWGTP